jgi:hypothetical protein
MGYVNNAAGATPQFIQSGRYEINVSGQRYPAKAFPAARLTIQSGRRFLA